MDGFWGSACQNIDVYVCCLYCLPHTVPHRQKRYRYQQQTKRQFTRGLNSNHTFRRRHNWSERKRETEKKTHFGRGRCAVKNIVFSVHSRHTTHTYTRRQQLHPGISGIDVLCKTVLTAAHSHTQICGSFSHFLVHNVKLRCCCCGFFFLSIFVSFRFVFGQCAHETINNPNA